jgi:hypothetical protein
MTVYTKFRFDFTSEVGNLLAKFSDEHETEKYNVFQSSWNSWINMEGVSDILTKECSRLREEGYTGDVWDKMYKSARYYYKKRGRSNKDKNSKTVERSAKIKFSERYLMKLNENIESQLNCNRSDNNVISLSNNDAFNEFCEVNKSEIVEELRLVKERYGELPKDIIKKLKKIFKNHFYNNRKNIEK